MGVLELFGTFIKNNITSSAVIQNYNQKTDCKHFLIDFNSIIYSIEQELTGDINALMKEILRLMYEKKPLKQKDVLDWMEEYGIEIDGSSSPSDVIDTFHAFFTDEKLTKMIIADIVRRILYLLDTFTKPNTLKTVFIAIDGVPSKGKMVEQKQRRYAGSIMDGYKKRILKKYTDYLKSEKNYIYLATVNPIKWSRLNIVPGTEFMNLLVKYLRGAQVQGEIKKRCAKDVEIIISDTHDIGEGEKKILNYIKVKLKNSKDNIIFYSPDGDAIVFALFVQVPNMFILKLMEEDNYSFIDATALKKNIGTYVNQIGKTKYSVERICYDLACMSTLFGNDFVPKMETFNVKTGFQKLMDIYFSTLSHYGNKYLVEGPPGKQTINFLFFRTIFEKLVPSEEDYMAYNDFYNKYIKAGQLKYVFDDKVVDINSASSIFNEFFKKYKNLQNDISQNRKTSAHTTDDIFMNNLKRALIIKQDGAQQINMDNMTNEELVSLIKDTYVKTKKFPRLNINLDTYSNSIKSPFHDRNTKEMNEYEKEYYKFEKMLDEYQGKLNAYPIKLSKADDNRYYSTFFNITVMKNNDLTKEAYHLMEEYIQGILWVFDYYFNDLTYINTWYYHHEKSPLIRHVLRYLNKITETDFNKLFKSIEKYHIEPKDFFNPVEHFLYVSPLSESVLKMLPENYRELVKKNSSKLSNVFIDVNNIIDEIEIKERCDLIDCRGVPYLNKCIIKTLGRNSWEEDKKYLEVMRKVVHDEQSLKLTKVDVLPF